MKSTVKLPLGSFASKSEDEQQLLVWLPKELHRKLRELCLDRGLTLKEFIIELLKEKLDGYRKGSGRG